MNQSVARVVSDGHEEAVGLHAGYRAEEEVAEGRRDGAALLPELAILGLAIPLIYVPVVVAVVGVFAGGVRGERRAGESGHCDGRPGGWEWSTLGLGILDFY